MVAADGEQSRKPSSGNTLRVRSFWPVLVILAAGGGALVTLQAGRVSLTDRPSSDLHFLL